MFVCRLAWAATEPDWPAQVHRAGEETWFQVQDLHVTDTLPQMVALSETYLQVYELRDASAVKKA